MSPECQPAARVSSTSSKLKNACTSGWHAAMSTAVVTSRACCAGVIFVVWKPSSRYQIDGVRPNASSVETRRV